jgi:transposase-like protein
MNIIEVYKKFPTQEDCIKHLEAVRWKGQPTCPYCNSSNITSVPKESRHHCNDCNTSFSVTVGTIFHKTKLDCQKWFLAISLVLNAKKGISARQLARDIEVNKRGRGTKKTPVVGMIERGGKVRAKVAKKGELTAKKLSSLVRRNVDTSNAILMTDEYKGYLRMSKFIEHKTINHQEWYVNGNIHTNNIESFWAILKRGIVGQYHKVSLHYLPKYIDEFCFRFNNRKNTEIFDVTISKALEVRA